MCKCKTSASKVQSLETTTLSLLPLAWEIKMEAMFRWRSWTIVLKVEPLMYLTRQLLNLCSIDVELRKTLGIILIRWIMKLTSKQWRAWELMLFTICKSLISRKVLASRENAKLELISLFNTSSTSTKSSQQQIWHQMTQKPKKMIQSYLNQI